MPDKKQLPGPGLEPPEPPEDAPCRAWHGHLFSSFWKFRVVRGFQGFVVYVLGASGLSAEVLNFKANVGSGFVAVVLAMGVLVECLVFT